MFVGFIILVVMVYKKKQAAFINEKLLQEIEHRNVILEKELEIQKKIQEERERISHDMHDDLGAGISALKLQAEFLKQKVEASRASMHAEIGHSNEDVEVFFANRRAENR
jgi:two-component system sensor histidine kinase DesK